MKKVFGLILLGWFRACFAGNIIEFQKQHQVEYGSMKDCSLPDFTAMLPLEYRREMKKIWGGFPSTKTRCERQLAQTRELIDLLPEELRERVLRWGVNVKEPTSQTSFLQGLGLEEVKRFNEILSTRALETSERSRLLRQWGSGVLDTEALTNLEKYILYLERRAERFRHKVKSLSTDARNAYERLESMKREKKNLIEEFSPSVRKELALLFRTKCPRFGVGDGSELDSEEIQLACGRVPEDEETVSTTERPSTTVDSIEIELSTFAPTRRYRPYPGGVPQLQIPRQKEVFDKLSTEDLLNTNIEDIAQLLKSLFPRVFIN